MATMPKTSKAAVLASLIVWCSVAAQNAAAIQPLPSGGSDLASNHSRSDDDALQEQSSPAAVLAKGFSTGTSSPGGTSPFATRLPRQERFQILTRNIWVKAGAETSVKIFLPSGTLVQGVCGGLQRLSAWQMSYDGSLTWTDDGADISAEIVRLSDQELVLVIKLSGGDVEETYTPAPVPSVLCPAPNG